MSSEPGRYGIEDLFKHNSLSPGYWKTLAGLRKQSCTISTDGSSLRFQDYPFEPASVFPQGSIHASQVSEVNLDSSPPVIRLTSGEVLFVPYTHKEALLVFVNTNAVRVASRSSVWSALLDPFLDTWEDQATIDRQFEWFASLGLDRTAVDQRRREVGAAMIAYNFGAQLWEWVSLSLYDCLIAQQASLSREDFKDFYARAMQLTTLDPLAPLSEGPVERSLANAIYSVLLDWFPKEKTDNRKSFESRIVEELTAAYSEPHRRYHTVEHVEACLGELDRRWAYAVRLNEVRWALLFHDAIYDPRRVDNEIKSAEWACRVMAELGRPEDEQGRVRQMILATVHAGAPATPDEALLLDIDLSILGASEPAFDDYDRGIAAEYEWVPEGDYRRARARVLGSFLERDRIYRTAAYRSLEAPARHNLQRAINRLK